MILAWRLRSLNVSADAVVVAVVVDRLCRYGSSVVALYQLASIGFANTIKTDLSVSLYSMLDVAKIIIVRIGSISINIKDPPSRKRSDGCQCERGVSSRIITRS